MDPRALPFDADTMLNGLRAWVECESPTWDAGAVNRMMDLVGRELVLAGAQIERIAGRMGFGDCVRATFPHPTPHAPGILVMGHLDTVHPVGTLAKLRFRREARRAWGPGIQDMKGGNYLALEAIRQLAHAGVTTRLPITVLFTSDEEVGSPSTRDLIEAEAARHRYVLIPEPARPGWRRGYRPLCHRALQSGIDRAPQPCRRTTVRGALGDPRDGAQADRDRGHDHPRLHV